MAWPLVVCVCGHLAARERACMYLPALVYRVRECVSVSRTGSSFILYCPSGSLFSVMSLWDVTFTHPTPFRDCLSFLKGCVSCCGVIVPEGMKAGSQAASKGDRE